MWIWKCGKHWREYITERVVRRGLYCTHITWTIANQSPSAPIFNGCADVGLSRKTPRWQAREGKNQSTDREGARWKADVSCGSLWQLRKLWRVRLSAITSPASFWPTSWSDQSSPLWPDLCSLQRQQWKVFQQHSHLQKENPTFHHSVMSRCQRHFSCHRWASLVPIPQS